MGPKYGKQLGEIRDALSRLDGNTAKAELDSKGAITLRISIGDIDLTAEDLLIEATQKEGFFTVSDRGFTVALDTTLTKELIDEGFVRELVSKLQTMRKEAGFNVTDHIAITLKGSETVTGIATDLSSDITGDTLADSLTVGEVKGYVKEWDINGENVVLGVERL